MDMAAFLAKFAQDLRDDQNGDGCFPDYAPHPSPHSGGSPGWADAGVILPWRSWQNYADRRLLEEHFEAARRWVERGHRNNPELIWPRNDNLANDWLNGDWIKQAGWPSFGGAVPSQVFSTAYFAHSTDLVAKMAGVLGRKEDAQRYGELFQQIKAARVARLMLRSPSGAIPLAGGLHKTNLVIARPLRREHVDLSNKIQFPTYQLHAAPSLQTLNPPMQPMPQTSG